MNFKKYLLVREGKFGGWCKECESRIFDSKCKCKPASEEEEEVSKAPGAKAAPAKDAPAKAKSAPKSSGKSASATPTKSPYANAGGFKFTAVKESKEGAKVPANKPFKPKENICPDCEGKVSLKKNCDRCQGVGRLFERKFNAIREAVKSVSKPKAALPKSSTKFKKITADKSRKRAMEPVCEAEMKRFLGQIEEVVSSYMRNRVNSEQFNEEVNKVVGLVRSKLPRGKDVELEGTVRKLLIQGYQAASRVI